MLLYMLCSYIASIFVCMFVLCLLHGCCFFPVALTAGLQSDDHM